MPGRTFSREFKLQVVREVASGTKRPAQVCREHNLANGVLLRWRQEYEQRGELAFGPRQESEPGSLDKKVVELERFCGQLALENDLLKKALRSSPVGSERP